MVVCFADRVLFFPLTKNKNFETAVPPVNWVASSHPMHTPIHTHERSTTDLHCSTVINSDQNAVYPGSHPPLQSHNSSRTVWFVCASIARLTRNAMHSWLDKMHQFLTQSIVSSSFAIGHGNNDYWTSSTTINWCLVLPMQWTFVNVTVIRFNLKLGNKFEKVSTLFRRALDLFVLFPTKLIICNYPISDVHVCFFSREIMFNHLCVEYNTRFTGI